MVKTTTTKVSASVTNDKSQPKKATKPSGVHSMKKSIEMVIKKGNHDNDVQKAVVDSHIPGAAGYEVAIDVFGEPMSICFNCSDLRKNNNKFYIMQVLQRKGMVGTGHMATLYTRFGRVGDTGVKSLKHQPLALM